jgi:ribonuclease T2
LRHGSRPQLGLPAGLQDGAPLIRNIRPPRLAALALFAALAAPASAQDSREFRGGRAGGFDLYVLALTWSPGFCELEGERKGREQCDNGQNLGFTVHGLWPQFERGYPTECAPAGRTPSRSALEEARGVYPDEGLARYEWRRHGTCSGKSPAEYFGDVRRARDRVRVPERFRSISREIIMTPLEIERAFAEANPGLRPDMMAVSCRRGVLQEVRICMDNGLRGFRRCPDVDRAGCGMGEVRMSPPR